ncbi:hypothetical protein TEA_000943 [Camellia sinensis var. sinensis]|uniref:Uncharacterized protein n=1 Tax=Camellia sinensis var. sinensis TaxID=542762 RepID=A0A4S4E5Q2_CAMSN|nr:hypothetical protein TEA_000943 [Camellia sinensis var. sinensis]
MSRGCSHCGNNGHNSLTCSDSSGCAAAVSGGGSNGGIMLFGVRLTEGSFRKSASMNNLAQYEQPQDSNPDVAAGYASDDVVHASGGSYERKRAMEEDRIQQETTSHLKNNLKRFPVSTLPATQIPVALPVAGNNSEDNLRLGDKKESNLIRPIPVIPVPQSSKMADLNLNHTPIVVDPLPLTLKLSTSPSSSSSDQMSPSSRHSSAFQAMSGGFNGSSGDSIISVA